MIGKYIELQDAYKSILESFVHAGAMNECKVQMMNIHSEFITDDNVAEKLGVLMDSWLPPALVTVVWKEKSLR